MLTGGCSPLVFYLQDVSQDGLGIYDIRVKVAPVVFLRDLGVQDGMVHADVLALLLSNLHHAVHAASALGIVEDIEVDGMTLALSLCDDAVLFLRTCSDARIVLRNSAKHVGTLADVHDVIVNLDAVDTCMFVLGSKAFALQPSVSIVCVSCHQNSKASFFGCGLHSPVATGWGITISSISGFWIITAPESIRLFIPVLFIGYLLFISLSKDGWG
jgi:hypothetical protein